MEDGTTKFVKNMYSWNKEATVIYIDSPAGVGYSMCPSIKGTECEFTDDNSADDNLAAFIQLMTVKMPELQNNPLYIAGESYAGIYVPKLVQRIDTYIKTSHEPFIPNLKGMIVGNPVTDHRFDGKPM